MSYVQANTNGRLHPANEPSISPLDRGFLYGDAVYEVWRSFDGVVFAWEEHWERLERSARALHFPLPVDRAGVLKEIRRTVAAFRAATSDGGDVYIRLQISRGEGRIGLDPALAEGSTVVLLVQPNPRLTSAQVASGLKLSLSTQLRRNAREALDPAWKTGNYLNNILCLREARSRGADEVVITNLQGEIAESAVSNIAFVRDGVILTPPLESGVLAGVTRRLLIEKIAPRLGLVVKEVRLFPDELSRMDECFLLSTTKDLAPVGAIDNVTFAIGEAAVVSGRLKRAFAEHFREYAESHRSQLGL